MRIRNPEVIFASWSSSAPVHAQVDMASYYKAAERSLTRNCSADWVAVTKYVDDVLGGSNETAATNIKFALEFARLSGKGGNTTLAQNLTHSEAAKISNVNAAGILMDPLNFYQVFQISLALLLPNVPTSTMASTHHCYLSATSSRRITSPQRLSSTESQQTEASILPSMPSLLHSPN